MAILLDIDGLTVPRPPGDGPAAGCSALTVAVEAGERCVLLGPAGSGKTALLHAVAGFLTPSAGRILLAGEPVGRPSPDQMLVGPEPEQVLPWKTVLQNVMFPMLASRRWPEPEARDRALARIARAGLEPLAHTLAHRLSAEDRLRVALARAIAVEPRLLLLDHPFSALDGPGRQRLQDELLALWNETRVTMLFATRTIEEAILIGSRILLLGGRPGRLRGEFDLDPGADGQPDTQDFMTLHHRIHRLMTTPDDGDGNGDGPAG